MGILQTLAQMEDGRFVISLGDVRIKVGSSDRDAAKLLIERIDAYADGKHTNGEVLTLLIKEWIEAVATHPETATPQEIFGHPQVEALFDALWWFRFLIALDSGEEAQDA